MESETADNRETQPLLSPASHLQTVSYYNAIESEYHDFSKPIEPVVSPVDPYHLLSSPNLNRIEDKLYLGNYASAKSAQNYQIKAVLSVTRAPVPDMHRGLGILYYWVTAEDILNQNLLTHFPETNRWITDCIESGRSILVHCKAGVSRSATIVCAYLMKRYGLSAEEAIHRVRQKRPFIRPNDGFLRQLKLYYQLGYTLDPNDSRLKKYLEDHRQWKSRRDLHLYRMNGLNRLKLKP